MPGLRFRSRILAVAQVIFSVFPRIQLRAYLMGARRSLCWVSVWSPLSSYAASSVPAANTVGLAVTFRRAGLILPARRFLYILVILGVGSVVSLVWRQRLISSIPTRRCNQRCT